MEVGAWTPVGRRQKRRNNNIVEKKEIHQILIINSEIFKHDSPLLSTPISRRSVDTEFSGLKLNF
jgi:hypothetical protein